MSNNNVTKLTVADKNETLENTKEPLLSWLSHAIVLSIPTPTAYLTGQVFHQAYMRAFRTNSELYPKGSADYFFYAFRAMFDLVPKWLQFAGADLRIIGLILFTITVTALIKRGASRLDKSQWMTRHREKAKNSKAFTFFGEIMLAPMVGLMVIYYIPIMLVVLMITPVLVGQAAGRNIAIADKVGFEGGCAHPKNKDAFCT